MGDDVNIYLVNNLEDLAEWIPIVSKGFHEIHSKGLGDESMEYVLSELFGHRLFLWIVILDGDYTGFFTTKKIQEHLVVHHMYNVSKKLNRKLRTVVSDFIDEHARVSGCNSIKLYTLRTADKYWGLLGYQKGYTEYCKNL